MPDPTLPPVVMNSRPTRATPTPRAASRVISAPPATAAPNGITTVTVATIGAITVAELRISPPR